VCLSPPPAASTPQKSLFNLRPFCVKSAAIFHAVRREPHSMVCIKRLASWPYPNPPCRGHGSL
jgi:hypothetical protein